MMRIIENKAKSILVKSKLPDTDYVVNPYTGCSFACSYCYASFMGRFVGEPAGAWGDYVFVKTNAVELFKAEFARHQFQDTRPTFLLSSVTDAWQGVEKKYRLARGILSVIADVGYSGRVSILTKSPLLLRDIDLLKQIENVEVGVTVTTDEDEIGRIYEGRAPRSSERLKILEELARQKIASYAFVGPLMTHYVDEPEKMDRLLSRIASAGVKFIYAELLNLSPKLLKRFENTLALNGIESRNFAATQMDPRRRADLASLVETLASDHGIKIRLGRVLDHAKPKHIMDTCGVPS